jgi:hypothetical protein
MWLAALEGLMVRVKVRREVVERDRHGSLVASSTDDIICHPVIPRSTSARAD